MDNARPRIETLTVEDHSGTNRATYDRIAEGYLNRQLELQASDPSPFGTLERHWLGLLPPGGRVADVGCGPALDGARFARAGYQVIGVDFSYGMLTRADGHLGGRLAQADMRSLPLASAALAGIWCVAALLHVPDSATPAVLAEFRRGLVRAGSLALVTALGDGAQFEAVPYAENERRWFVYRSRERLERQIEDLGYRIRYSDVVLGNRLWLTVLAQRGG